MLVGDTAHAVHIASHARDLERLAGGASLEHRYRLVRRGAFVEQAPETMTGGEAEGDLGLHVRELLLHELIGGERPADVLRDARPYHDPEADYAELLVRRNAPRWIRMLHHYGLIEHAPAASAGT